MAADGNGERLTELLNLAKSGDRAAESELAPQIYQELRRLARYHMRRERSDHTLQVTGLVHEAYLRLMRPSEKQWTDRAHFFAVAAGAMRRVLVDYARTRKAAKRGGGQIAASVDAYAAIGDEPQSLDSILDVNSALTDLAHVDARAARVIELRFFAGMDTEEIADVLGLSSRTIRRDLEFAQAWLYGRIAESREQEKKEHVARPPLASGHAD
jgi:RNA polymerase sigma factor (TIGR02999 family)